MGSWSCEGRGKEREGEEGEEEEGEQGEEGEELEEEEKLGEVGESGDEGEEVESGDGIGDSLRCSRKSSMRVITKLNSGSITLHTSRIN
jgi:hypothetical protein